MKLARVRGYTFVVVSAAAILAALVLLGLQWGNFGDFSAYGKNIRVSMSLLMVFSAAGGLAMFWLVRLFVYGVRTLGRNPAEPKPAQPPSQPPPSQLP